MLSDHFTSLIKFEKMISSIWTWDFNSYMSYKQKNIYFATLNCLF